MCKMLKTIGFTIALTVFGLAPLMAQTTLVGQLDSAGNTLADSIVTEADSPVYKIKPLGLPRDTADSVAKPKNEKSVISDSAKVEKKNQPDSTALTTSGVEENGVGKAAELREGASEKIEQISELISGDNIFYSIVFLIFGFFFIRLLSYVLNALAERSPNYRIAFKGAVPIIKVVTWSIIITLIIVVIFKPSITTMLAFSASIGVAVGFASQDILKNIFGGIVVLIDRPFVSGDKIEVEKYYGEVVEIGLRSTRIVTPDDSVVSIPNAVMMSNSVSNANSGELNCQVVAEIYLPNDTQVNKARSIATEAASISKYIYLNKPIVVLFFHEMNQNGSYLKMKVKAYVMDTRDEFKFKSEMTEIIMRELIKEGMLH